MCMCPCNYTKRQKRSGERAERPTGENGAGKKKREVGEEGEGGEEFRDGKAR